jgi:hypothetical protein
MQKKIIFIPGWMKSVRYYGDFQGADIWCSRFDINKIADVDYILAHSAGCNYILANWKNNNKTKFIFINPLLPKRNFLNWMRRWTKYAFSGAMTYDKQVSFIYFPYAWLKFLLISFLDPVKSIKNIGRDKVIVLRGSGDNYFCDNQALEVLKNEKINYYEVENSRHEWDEKFRAKIKEIIEN